MIKTIIILVFSLTILTGCKVKEIEDYAIVSGIGIDYIDDEYEVSFEIFEENNGETIDLTSKVIAGKGKAIGEAVTNINTLISQTLYMNHCLVIVFGKNVAESSFSTVINYLVHDTRIRSSCYLVVSEEMKAQELLEKSKDSKQVISYNIYNQLEKNNNYLGVWNNCKFNYCMNEYLNKNNCVILPIVKFKENNVNIEDAYAISGNNAYILSNEEVFIVQLFNDKINEGLFKSENYLYIKNCKSKIKIKDEEVSLFCDIEGLSYETKGEDFSNVEEQKKYIVEMKELLNYKILDIFEKYKSLKLDIFGINKYIYKYHPLLYKKIQDDYLYFYSGLKLNTNINLKLLSSGLTEDTLE